MTLCCVQIAAVLYVVEVELTFACRYELEELACAFFIAEIHATIFVYIDRLSAASITLRHSACDGVELAFLGLNSHKTIDCSLQSNLSLNAAFLSVGSCLSLLNLRYQCSKALACNATNTSALAQSISHSVGRLNKCKKFCSTRQITLGYPHGRTIVVIPPERKLAACGSIQAFALRIFEAEVLSCIVCAAYNHLPIYTCCIVAQYGSARTIRVNGLFDASLFVY